MSPALGQADPEVKAISLPLDSSSGTHLIPPWGTGIRNKMQRTGPCRLAQPRGTHQKNLDTKAIRGPGQTRRQWGPLSRCHCGKHPENAAAAAPVLPPQTGPQQAEEGTPGQPGPQRVSGDAGRRVPDRRAERASLTSIRGRTSSHGGGDEAGGQRRRRAEGALRRLLGRRALGLKGEVLSHVQEGGGLVGGADIQR